MDLYITGFGKFGDIIDNPSATIIQDIANDLSLTEMQVIEVSVEGSLQTLNAMQSRALVRKKPCIFIHFGLHAEAKTIHLEKYAYNLADFRIPDERGQLIKQSLILSDCKSKYETKIPLEVILEDLQGFDFTLSTDPGRFICNLVYFHSLHWLEQNEKQLPDAHALFVHIPSFDRIPQYHQVEAIKRLIRCLSTFRR
uniref:Uncharacterized protein AlNc14C376G11177 n=1 Tax=Albugo laibachii Nc14 TaxID=890382 RepID=F0WYB8_9STRA|nr:hypothetical protein TTHERM_00349070 [Albugo laibachii Nc14]|eukprot:CCA26470.1 hypothetical protein TTHERM_00349070 [Albugo laibachii Nc14]